MSEREQNQLVTLKFFTALHFLVIIMDNKIQNQNNPRILEGGMIRRSNALKKDSSPAPQAGTKLISSFFTQKQKPSQTQPPIEHESSEPQPQLKQRSLNDFIPKKAKGSEPQTAKTSKKKQASVQPSKKKEVVQTDQINAKQLIQNYLGYFRQRVQKELDQPLKQVCQKIVDQVIVEQRQSQINYSSESVIKWESYLRIAKFIFYKLIMPSTTNNWEFLYAPELSTDILDDRNSKYLKFWMKISFFQLKKGKKNNKAKGEFVTDESQEESAAFSQTDQTDNDRDLLYNLKVDSKTQKWNYWVLRVVGGHGVGKCSLVKAVAKENKIEIIETNDFTEKQDFEELLSSQKISAGRKIFKSQQQDQLKTVTLSQDMFNINEKQDRKKIILHRSDQPKLPRFFDKISQEQKIPMVWLNNHSTLSQIQNVDEFEFVQYSNLEISMLVFMIVMIEENFRHRVAHLTNQIKDTITQTKLTQIDNDPNIDFFRYFGIDIGSELSLIDKQSSESGLSTSFTFQEVFELSFHFQGDLRAILNWINFYHRDSFPALSLYQQTRLIPNSLTLDDTKNRLIYKQRNIKFFNKLHLNDNIDSKDQQIITLEKYSQMLESKSYDDVFKRHQEDDPVRVQDKDYFDTQEIVKTRRSIIKKHIQPNHFSSLQPSDFFIINNIYKAMALYSFPNDKKRTRRNNSENVCQIDLFQTLMTVVTDQKDYELFKYFDDYERLILKQGKLRKNRRETSEQ